MVLMREIVSYACEARKVVRTFCRYHLQTFLDFTVLKFYLFQLYLKIYQYTIIKNH